MVELVEKGQIVMIDGGSTTYEVARNLSQFRRDLVVITNSPGIASIAGSNPTFRVILCPGNYDHREGSVFGEETIEFIGRYNADLAIIGASGITIDGPNDTISGAVSVKRAMIARSLSTILAITHEKFGRASLQQVCKLADISDVATEPSRPPASVRLSKRPGSICMCLRRADRRAAVTGPSPASPPQFLAGPRRIVRARWPRPHCVARLTEMHAT